MQLGTNGFDIWVFSKQSDINKYLLLHTSQEKADKWFNGGRFWQILGGPFIEGEEVAASLRRPLEERGLEAMGIWAVEHTYIIFNSRRKRVEILPVFAAEIAQPLDIPLTWEHAEAGWYTAEECEKRIHFRGLKDGLKWTRTYVSEAGDPAPELRIF